MMIFAPVFVSYARGQGGSSTAEVAPAGAGLAWVLAGAAAAGCAGGRSRQLGVNGAAKREASGALELET